MLALPRTRAVLERGIAEGLHAGAQLCTIVRGEPVELALGLAAPGRPMRPDSIVLWMSSTKPLMCAAIGQLVERGVLGLDDPVANHVPEFAANGKAGITLRHLLTHTACIPNAHRQWSHESWDEIIAKICAAAPEPGWTIGVDCSYHVASAWYVLGEVVRRADGRSYARYLREEVMARLDARDFWVGMDAAEYAANAARIGQPFDATSGAPKPMDFWAMNGSSEALAYGRPGGAGWGTARALAGFYAALLGGGAPLLRSDTLACFTTLALPGANDRNLGFRLNRALGFVRNSVEFGGPSAWYGNRASPRAFGHAGYYSSVAFADPAHELALALAWNCFRAPDKHDAEARAALDALYDDLGL